ncbi:hypothetical protein DKX38_024502 [Salix brachista]|uniref:Integrator complex subunit 4/Protein SIEL C-terminal Ig-like domain-containing protein n=1 Tax=Salix brachista TaxID=2182728 RepID=A0A5N5JS64_9ROSI|nr:hypothetical protein DKX38_024502 [Salix brachista]
MEHHLLHICLQSLKDNNNPPSLQALASLRSLIINPNTSDSTIYSILETLTHSLQLSTNSLTTHHHILKLLTDLASQRTHLSSQILNSIHSSSLLFTESTQIAAESLTSLASFSNSDQNKIDDQLFMSLCFAATSASARLRLLRNGERLGIGTHMLFTVFLGFTKDPYPYVRKASLDGLLGLCKSCDLFEDISVTEGCYCRAVELLQDNEHSVRSAAIRVVCEWGQMLIAAKEGNDKIAQSNQVFVQICSMVRDMSVEVRVEAFNALGKIKLVSEDILLQTISKKVLAILKDKNSHGQCTAERFEILASSYAGAFMHGLEDEFHEVRKSACNSLRIHTILYAEFARRSLSLLMDMLNDDSMAVRLEALEALHHMATFDCLNVQEIHMHMFLGSLLDSCDLIRSTARKIFKLVKLPDLKLFRLSIHGLLQNLERYSKDEADVFSVLFFMGRSHGNFAAHIVKEVSQEIEPVLEGQLGLDSARVAAFLVLAISAPLSQNQNGQIIPPRLFSYAVTLLGRISCALSEVVDQDTLLAYLSQCSRSSTLGAEVEVESLLPVVDDVVLNRTKKDVNNPVEAPMLQTGNETSKVQPVTSCELEYLATSIVECQADELDEVMKSVNLILARVRDAWLLVQSRCTNVALRALRDCKRELAMLTSTSLESSGAMAFTLQYLQVMKLFAKIWEHAVWKIRSNETGGLEYLFGKLDMRLRELRYRYIGFSTEEELYVLELIAVACILRLSKVEISCSPTTMKKLSAIISHIEILNDKGSIEPSNILMDAKKTVHEIESSKAGISCSLFLITNLDDFFTLKQFSLCSRVRHINAELNVPGNDSENPLRFVSGLPVAIPLDITLYNVSSENRLWLTMRMSEESTQFVFLDLNILGGCNEVKKFTFMAPFYRTPKACSFSLWISIGMECALEDCHILKHCGGPRRDLVYLFQEKEVHLCLVRRG